MALLKTCFPGLSAVACLRLPQASRLWKLDVPLESTIAETRRDAGASGQHLPCAPRLHGEASGESLPSLPAALGAYGEGAGQ